MKDVLHVTGELFYSLKYGENPHQKNANLYALPGDDPLALHKFKIEYSSDPASYVTMTDVDRVIDTVCRIAAAFDVNNVRKQRIAVAVKHGNACGAAYSVETVDAIKKCVQGDREAVLGAVVACNFDIGEYELEALFTSHSDGKRWGMLAGIVCTSITEAALRMLKSKIESKNSKCIVFTNPGFEHSHMGMHSLDTAPKMRAVRGGMLVQDAPVFIPDFTRDLRQGICTFYGDALPVHSKKASLLLAWAICSTSNSNTITVVHNGQLLGNAVGQQKRVASSELAMKKALFATGGDEAPFLQSVAWSDSYFPYPDGIEVLQKHGISIVGATTGSRRDEEVIEFCRNNGVTFITYPDAVARGFSNH